MYKELSDMLQDMAYAQSMVNRTVSRLNRLTENVKDEDDLAEHDKEVIRKFAEWIVRKNGYLNLFNNDSNALLAKYEKEQKGETE